MITKTSRNSLKAGLSVVPIQQVAYIVPDITRQFPRHCKTKKFASLTFGTTTSSVLFSKSRE